MVMTSFTSYSGGISSDIRDDKNVFVWNAVNSEVPYQSNGSQTFNINVPDGISGVFIQHTSLNDLIDNKLSSALSGITETYNEALNLIDDILN